jgi:ring-1,2-phenylacetyl-CoA epoxidase subunit PaaE
MAFFKNIFGKKVTPDSQGFYVVKVKDIKRVAEDALQIRFDIPQEIANEFKFVPGQYINLKATVNGEELIRSYSICTPVGEDIGVGIRILSDGKFSSWIEKELKEGTEISVSTPLGNFKLLDKASKFVFFAAGSGITPILSMLASCDHAQLAASRLFYGNRDQNSLMFEQEITRLVKNGLSVDYLFSRAAEVPSLRLDQNTTLNLLKSELELLKSDAFYICGPEAMIIGVSKALETLGVNKDKIHFELFGAPVSDELAGNKSASASEEQFSGKSEVTVTLDDEDYVFTLATDGDTILDEVEASGIDAPYSCRGGVCCTCKAKIIEGSARMETNMSLTDQEVKEGFILTCQAHPTSAKLKITFDV